MDKATLGETMWVVYYSIAKRSQNFTLKGIEITPDYWDSAFSTTDKLSGSLKNLGILGDFSNLIKDVKYIDSRMKNSKDFFSGPKGWHVALKSQTQKFVKESKLNFIKKLQICRQDYFYDKSNINDFLKKVYKDIFNINVKYDRWNPADVWFFDESVISEIQKYIKSSVVMGNTIQNLPKNIQKKYAIDDLYGLNRLIYKLYEQKKLAPISLKKATLTKESLFSYRVGLVNLPQTEILPPKPPSVKERVNSISSYGSSGFKVGDTLKYVVEVPQLTYDSKGKMKYEKETDTIRYIDAVSGSLKVEKQSGVFNESAGGSMGIQAANSILYTSDASRKLQKIRGQVFNGLLSSNIISNGRMLGKDVSDKKSNALNYMDLMANDIEPSFKNKKMNIKGGYTSSQNKLEIAFSILNSGNKNKQDEIILDLWSAITSKGIVNRKDSEKMVEKLGKNLYNKSRKMGQKNLTQEQADVKARAILATKDIDVNKISGSFHIKLY
jgi:hypothetical protein